MAGGMVFQKGRKNFCRQYLNTDNLMAGSIIEVKNISKRFILNHEGGEKYTALRDVVAQKLKKTFSFPESLRGTKETKEEFWALKDVSFNVEQGDRVGIIGRNGAGKSTLLKILSRITEPTSGEIRIKGRVASLLEVGTGFHPELTGRENIFLNGAILGMSRKEIKRKFDEIVDFAEVEKFLDTPVKRYSSGMYVRLAFAVAAHLEPEILIVDEVLAVGDAQFQKKCLGKMKDVSKNEGRTVLFVSHNMGVIGNLCTSGILLNRGIIESKGDIRKVVDCYISKNNYSEEMIYKAKEENVRNKINYFKMVSLLNSKGQNVADFSFDESIKISFEFTAKHFLPGLVIGIGIQDKLQNRVTTFFKPADFFQNKEGDTYYGVVDLPSKTISPNLYSLVFALWIKGSVIFDLLENICPFKIHDNGTEFSIYEGLDYGSFILNPQWQ